MKKIFFAPKPATEVKIFFPSDDPEKKILLYIGKWINGKFSISVLSGEILTNQVDFWEVVLGRQLSKFVKKFQIYPNSNDQSWRKIQCGTQKLVFVSKLKIRVGCHGH